MLSMRICVVPESPSLSSSSSSLPDNGNVELSKKRERESEGDEEEDNDNDKIQFPIIAETKVSEIDSERDVRIASKDSEGESKNKNKKKKKKKKFKVNEKEKSEEKEKEKEKDMDTIMSLNHNNNTTDNITSTTTNTHTSTSNSLLPKDISQSLLLSLPLLSTHINTALSWSSPSSLCSSWPTVSIPSITEIRSKMSSWLSHSLTDILSQYNLYRFRHYLSTLPVDNRQVDICFHGTQASRVPSILVNGICVPGDTNKTLDNISISHRCDSGYWGLGIYCSPFDSTSARFSEQDKGGGFVLLAARGKVANIENKILGGKCTEGYHSHTAQSDKEWILFDSDALLLFHCVKFTGSGNEDSESWKNAMETRKNISIYFEEKEKRRRESESETQ